VRARRAASGMSTRTARAEPTAGVEVVDGSQRVVDRRRLGLGHGLEVATVVAHRPVPGLGACERVAVEGGVGQPGQVLARFGAVGPPCLGGQWSDSQGSVVGVEDVGVARQDYYDSDDGTCRSGWRRGSRRRLGRPAGAGGGDGRRCGLGPAGPAGSSTVRRGVQGTDLGCL